MFDGNGQEALDFYAKALKAEVTQVMRYSEGEGFEVPDGYEDKVLHAELAFGDSFIYLSDNFPGSTTTSGTQISLNLAIDTDDQLTETFAALSEGGKITQPIKEEFWGAKFGSLDDKFGIHWSLNYSLPQE